MLIKDKLKKDEATCKRSRDERERNFLNVMMTEMTEIKKLMKNKSAATVITKALKETDDDEIKKS